MDGIEPFYVSTSDYRCMERNLNDNVAPSFEMFLKIGVYGFGFKTLPGYEDDAEKAGYFASHW